MTHKEKMTQIVEKFINILENDEAGNWLKPWTSTLPMNYASNSAYKGFNIISLAIEAQEQQFSTNNWMTFNQAKKLGGSIKKGQKGSPVFFYQSIEVKENDSTGTEVLKSIPMLKSYTIFNLDQLKGIKVAVNSQLNKIEAAEEFVNAAGAVIEQSPDQAYFSPSKDVIAMPNMNTFTDQDNYYATLLHELTHWSGHVSRLDRDMSGSFGSDTYAFEELVAELGSAFLCNHLGINLENAQHPEYLKSWIKALKNNPKVLWKAASKAQQSFEFLIQL